MNRSQWAWLALIQAVWAGSYVAMKVAGAAMPVVDVLFFRYGIASIGFLILFFIHEWPRFRRRDIALMVAVGVFNFAISPALQVKALTYTQAIDVSILISFEPLLTVLMAAIILREAVQRSTWIVLGIATLGVFFLSGALSAIGGEGGAGRLLGNGLFLASLLSEATNSIVGKPLTERYRPSASTGVMIIAGFVAITAVRGPAVRLADFEAVSQTVWFAILFLGLGCSLFAYTMWYRIIQRAPVSQVALSLFLQPIFGSLTGYLLLDERISVQSLVGSVLIVGSLLWWQTRSFSKAAG